MRRAINKIFTTNFAELPVTQRNSPEIKDYIFDRISRNENFIRQFSKPNEFEVTFHEVYQELLA